MKKMSGISTMGMNLTFENCDVRTRTVMCEIFKQADKLRIKRIGIGTRDKTFKDSEGWPFDNDNNIFVDGRCSGSGCPKAWKLVENVDKALSKMQDLFPLEDYHNFWKHFRVIDGGAGNNGQRQIYNIKFIVPGIYENVNGKWKKCS